MYERKKTVSKQKRFPRQEPANGLLEVLSNFLFPCLQKLQSPQASYLFAVGLSPASNSYRIKFADNCLSSHTSVSACCRPVIRGFVENTNIFAVHVQGATQEKYRQYGVSPLFSSRRVRSFGLLREQRSQPSFCLVGRAAEISVVRASSVAIVRSMRSDRPSQKQNNLFSSRRNSREWLPSSRNRPRTAPTFLVFFHNQELSEHDPIVMIKSFYEAG